jgi:homocitrate synthase NifV
MGIEAHEHNDFGMAIANSLEMANMGAEYIDCTLFGIGERAGNCDMYDFIHACESKYHTGINKNEVLKAMELLSGMMRPTAENFI